MAAVEFSHQASETGETAWFFSRLFAGVDLSPDLKASARAIVADCVHQMRAVRPLPASARDQWDSAMAQYAERDRRLGELLPGTARDRFEHNAIELRAHFDTLRANAGGV